jgi:chaperonin GroES
MSIRPLNDRVLVRRVETEDRSPGGIVLPDSAKEKPVMGIVVAVGTGKPLDNGEVRPLAVKVDDRVLFGKFAGTEIHHDNEDLLVMREDDIVGIVE